jgi:hypothetical protein
MLNACGVAKCDEIQAEKRNFKKRERGRDLQHFLAYAAGYEGKVISKVQR